MYTIFKVVLVSLLAFPNTGAQLDNDTLTLSSPSGSLEVYAMPVGQGDCTIFQCPNGKIIVNDCGSSGGKGFSAQQIQSFLGNKIGDVVAILISHPDRDHFNYLYDIMWQTASIQSVIIGGTLQDYNGAHSQFMRIFNWLQSFNTLGKLRTVNGGASCLGTCTVSGGTNFCSSSNINFKILAANVGTTSNQKSIVMKVTSGSFSILSPVDIEGTAATTIAQNQIVQPQLHSFLYKMAHHGASSMANKPTWLTPIAPREAFASSGYNFGNCRHLRCDTITRLLALGTVNTAPPHTLYCGTSGAPQTMTAFAFHMYETSPTPNDICLLSYTSTGLFAQTCIQGLETPVGLGDDECPQPEDLEEEGGGGPIPAAHYSIIIVAALSLLTI